MGVSSSSVATSIFALVSLGISQMKLQVPSGFFRGTPCQGETGTVLVEEDAELHGGVLALLLAAVLGHGGRGDAGARRGCAAGVRSAGAARANWRAASAGPGAGRHGLERRGDDGHYRGLGERTTSVRRGATRVRSVARPTPSRRSENAVGAPEPIRVAGRPIHANFPPVPRWQCSVSETEF